MYGICEFYKTTINREYMLTPSREHMQLVQGLGNMDSPIATRRSLIWQPWLAVSFHAVRSMCGCDWHGTRGFKKFDGRSNAALCMSEFTSKLSQMTLARVILRISASWASVNRIVGSSFSYLQVHFT